MASPMTVLDTLQRPMRDLRISVTDRCNFRCGYCMPREAFGPDHAFLPSAEILDFDEIERVVRAAVSLGVRKVRLTGGEPLVRRGLEGLVARLATLDRHRGPHAHDERIPPRGPRRSAGRGGSRTASRSASMRSTTRPSAG